jgi:long-chain acyl-CoA synthetase
MTTSEEMIEWCKENMSAYKRPRKIEFVEELPKSAVGKLLRRVLSEKENREEVNGEIHPA